MEDSAASVPSRDSERAEVSLNAVHGGAAFRRSVRSCRRATTHPKAEIGGGIFGSGLGFGWAGHERLSGKFLVDDCYQSAWRKFWQGFQP